MEFVIKKLKKYGKNSVYIDFFKYSFAVVFALFTTITVTFVAVYCYNISSVQKSDLIIENNKRNTELESYFNIADNIFYQYVDEDVKSFLNNDVHDIEYYRDCADLQGTLRKIINISQYIESIYVYSIKNDYVFSSINSNSIPNFDDLNWYRFYRNTGNTNFIVYSDKGNKVLSKCYGIIQEKNLVGILIINIDFNIDKGISHLLLDGEGRFLYGYKNGLSVSEIEISNDRAKKVSRYKGKYLFLSAIDAKYSILSLTEAISERLLSRAILAFIFCILISTMVAAAFSFKHAEYYYKKVSDIVLGIQTIADGKSIKDENEIEYVKKITRGIVGRYENIQSELVDAISKLNETQNKALQAQINPHFLFNTLNAVNCLILQETNEDNQSIKIVELLSDILEYIMDNKRNLVRLSEEIAYTKKYIEIELIKKNYSFDVEWQIQNIQDCYIIKMVLQPIVENAIYHGIRNLHDLRGKIQIEIGRQNEDLLISVSDNGNGCGEKRMAEVNEALGKSSINDSGHIGLRNVNERIKIVYGDPYGCQLVRVKGRTECRIRLPYFDADNNLF